MIYVQRHTCKFSYGHMSVSSNQDGMGLGRVDGGCAWDEAITDSAVGISFMMIPWRL